MTSAQESVGASEIINAISTTAKAAKTTIGLAGEAWSAWREGKAGDFAMELLEDPKPVNDVVRDVQRAVKAIEKVAPILSRVAGAAPPALVPPMLRLASARAATDGASLVQVGQASGGGLIDSVTSAASPLGLVNLGVGLANLGVGLYNAYQLGQVRAEVSAMHSEMNESFRAIQGILDVQSRQLAVLLDGQVRLESQVENLRRQMVTGFTAVLDQLGDMESRRRGEELQKLSLIVTKSWQLVLEAVADGEKPSDNDMRRLGDAGVELEAWADTQLGNLAVGSPGRLPYFVAKALAVRASADAKQAETGNISRSAVRQIGQLASEIQREVRAIAHGKTLYEVGVTLAPFIAQYASLRRGLLAGCVEQTSAHSERLVWDDGLADLRMVVAGFQSGGGQDELLPLGTIADMQWYLEWAGLPETTDLRGTDGVRLGEILGRMGAPSNLRPSSPAAIPGLLMLALPRYRELGQKRINEEFGWTEPLEILAPPAKGAGDPKGPAPEAEGRASPARIATKLARRFWKARGVTIPWEADLKFVLENDGGKRRAWLYHGGIRVAAFDVRTGPRENEPCVSESGAVFELRDRRDLATSTNERPTRVAIRLTSNPDRLALVLEFKDGSEDHREAAVAIE